MKIESQTFTEITPIASLSIRYRWYGILGSILVHVILLFLLTRFSEPAPTQHSPAFFVRLQKPQSTVYSHASQDSRKRSDTIADTIIEEHDAKNSPAIPADIPSEDAPAVTPDSPFTQPLDLPTPQEHLAIPSFDAIDSANALLFEHSEDIGTPGIMDTLEQSPKIGLSHSPSSPETPESHAIGVSVPHGIASRKTILRIEQSADLHEMAPASIMSRPPVPQPGTAPPEQEKTAESIPYDGSFLATPANSVATANPTTPTRQPAPAAQSSLTIPHGASSFANRLNPLVLPPAQKTSMAEQKPTIDNIEKEKPLIAQQRSIAYEEGSEMANNPLPPQDETRNEASWLSDSALQNSSGIMQNPAIVPSPMSLFTQIPSEGAIAPAPEPEPQPEPFSVAAAQDPPVASELASTPETPAPPDESSHTKPLMTTSESVLKKILALLDSRIRYPAAALKRKIEGTVVLAVDIMSNGQLSRIAFRSRSGSAVLDDAAFSLLKSIFPLDVHMESSLTIVVPIEYRIPK